MRFSLFACAALGAGALCTTAAAAAPALAQAVTQPACLAERAWPLSFTQAGALDTATVTAYGPSCSSAIVTLVVRDAEGVIVHDAIWPAAWMVTPDATPQVLSQALESVAPRVGATSSTLPAYASLTPEREFALLPAEEYTAARTADAGVLCWRLDPTLEVCAVFNPGAGRGVPVLERVTPQPE